MLFAKECPVQKVVEAVDESMLKRIVELYWRVECWKCTGQFVFVFLNLY